MENASLKMLEFDKILEIISSYTTFSASKELILSLNPSEDAGVVSLKLRQSSESRHLLSLHPNFSMGQVSDIRGVVSLAAKGKMLEAKDIVRIKETIAAARNVYQNLKRLASEIPELWNIAANIIPFQELENEIEKCIDINGEISDTASEKLASLRYQFRESRQRLTEKLEAILKSRNKQRYIQESYITERDQRYVIPVKAESRKEIRGIVHDVSNTGNTIFIEPLETVELGNDLRQVVIAEKLETERILSYLSAEIGSRESEICSNVAILADLDVNLAKARYAEQIKAVEPFLRNDPLGSETNYTDTKRVLYLENARHPLLKGKPVPLTIEMGRDFNILVITGPNAGGKTVALKTIGLLALMTQAGIPIPVSEGSIFPVFKGIFADIGDQQSIEQTLSTFSWHIGNIVNIMKQASSESLVLLDELGISTDPEEGSALARAILLDFLSRRTIVVATTHYNELKTFAHTTPGIQNASLDYDPVTLLPTYKLTLGIPGRSNAISVASRLGLGTEIIQRAKSMLHQSSAEMELLLADLLEEKNRYENMLLQLEEDRKRLDLLQAKLKEDEAKMIAKERKLLNEINDTFAEEMAVLQKSIRAAEIELKKTRKLENINRAKKIASLMQEEMQHKSEKALAVLGEEVKKPLEPISLGDVVRLRDRDIAGMLISVDIKSNQAVVKVGNTNLNVDLRQIEGRVIPPEEPSKRYPQLKKRRNNLRTINLELDLRGKRVDQVEVILDRFLNDAFLSNLQQVRVVHGYATGAVRQVVRELLSHHALVASYEAGATGEGGDGVTLVNIKL